MAKIKKNEALADRLNDDAILDRVSLKNAVKVDETVEEQQPNNSLTGERTPLPDEPEWNDYVLSLLTPNELVEGNPTCDGLRRIAEKLIGPIKAGLARVVQAPNPQNDMTATVEFTIHFLDGEAWTSVADVNSSNCEPKFARFASAVAETRAEGRALRKALRLRKVVTAEEPEQVTDKGDLFDSEKSSQMQQNTIVHLCERNNIDIDKFLSEAKGFTWSGNVQDIPKRSAVTIISVLSEMQRTGAIDKKYLIGDK